jgi:hypothetical protein
MGVRGGTPRGTQRSVKYPFDSNGFEGCKCVRTRLAKGVTDGGFGGVWLGEPRRMIR